MKQPTMAKYVYTIMTATVVIVNNMLLLFEIFHSVFFCSYFSFELWNLTIQKRAREEKTRLCKIPIDTQKSNNNNLAMRLLHCDVTRHLLSMNSVTSYYLGKVLYTHEPRDNHTHLLARFHSIKDA